jgi:hypothetical protein
MVSKFKVSCVLLILFFSVSLLAGCGAVGMMIGGMPKEYTLNKTIKLKKSYPNILELVAESGKELGYRIAGMDEKLNSVTLGTDMSYIQIGLIGKSNMSRLTITKQNDKLLNVSCFIMGNFGAAEYDNAMKVYGDFENKLLSKLH